VQNDDSDSHSEHSHFDLTQTQERRGKLDYWIATAETTLRKNIDPELRKMMPRSWVEPLEQWSKSCEEKIGFAPPDSEFYIKLSLVLAKRNIPMQLDRRPPLPDLPEQLTRAERLAQLLEIVWADADFWQIMHSHWSANDTDNALRNYLRTTHVLQIDYPSSVWQEMVREPMKRRYLFYLMVNCPTGFFFSGDPRDPTGLSGEWENVIPTSDLGQMLRNYISRPSDDNRARLSSKNYPGPVLQILASAAAKLHKDAKWCENHDNQLLAPRAPNPPHPPHKLDKSIIIEKLVDHIRSDLSLLQRPSKLVRLELGKPTSKERRYGSEAIELFKLRECFLDPGFVPDPQRNRPPQ
jgi:hypothetical protein